MLQYASAILYHSPSQKALAERSVAAQARPVLTKVLPARVFYEAET